jgi:hypothetical protein
MGLHMGAILMFMHGTRMPPLGGTLNADWVPHLPQGTWHTVLAWHVLYPHAHAWRMHAALEHLCGK